MIMRQIRGALLGERRNSLIEIGSKDALQKRLRSCYDKSRDTPLNLSQAEYSGCVYVIECQNTSIEQAEWISKYKHGKVEIPWWIAPAESATQRLYVGRTTDITDRLWDHIRGFDSGGAHFTSIFRPHRLRRVFLYDKYEYRNLLEGKISQTTDRENDTAFVYSDRYDTLRGYKDYGEKPTDQHTIA